MSDQKGPQELIAHNETGLITRGLDVEDLAAAIVRLGRDADLRLRLGGSARRAVETRSWAGAAEKFWQQSPR